MSNQAIWEKALNERIEKLEETVGNLYSQVQSMESEIFLLQTELAEIKEEDDPDRLRLERQARDAKILPPSQPGDELPSGGVVGS